MSLVPNLQDLLVQARLGCQVLQLAAVGVLVDLEVALHNAKLVVLKRSACSLRLLRQARGRIKIRKARRPRNSSSTSYDAEDVATTQIILAASSGCNRLSAVSDVRSIAQEVALPSTSLLLPHDRAVVDTAAAVAVAVAAAVDVVTTTTGTWRQCIPPGATPRRRGPALASLQVGVLVLVERKEIEANAGSVLVQLSVLHEKLLLLPVVSLTIDNGLEHAKEIAFDQTSVADGTFKAVHVIQEAFGPHDKLSRT